MTSRRTFLETSVLAATAAGFSRRATATPSDRVRVGFIGVGNRGHQLLDAFAAQADVEVAALCDVYEPYLRRDAAAIHPRYKAMGRVPRLKTAVAAAVPRERDFRRVLDRKDVDAVCIATPDHWHAVQRSSPWRPARTCRSRSPSRSPSSRAGGWSRRRSAPAGSWGSA